MKTITKLLLTALAVLLLANILPGIYVDSFLTSVVVAIVLALLKLIVKPLLIILTLSITILTFGLFLLIINAIVVLLAGYFVSGFEVDGVWYALIFSLLLSLFQSILFSLIKEEQKVTVNQILKTLQRYKKYVLLHSYFYQEKVHRK